MRIDFTKMHGAGNDFIVFDLAAGQAPPPAHQLRKLADRHAGIGFDQALLLNQPDARIPRSTTASSIPMGTKSNSAAMALAVSRHFYTDAERLGKAQ